MRKYDSKNKRNIGIIVGICLIFAIIFSYFLIKEIRINKIKYELEENTVLFDIDKNNILLKTPGIIKRKWNNKYYLTYNEEKYQIGSHVIAFNNNEKSLTLYGKFYEVNNNNEINITEEETKLNNLVISRLYKISDRKYLLVDSDIKTDDNLLKTSNYLIVELDKQGNALLYNNSINLKAFKETKIITSSYTLDIAKELLKYGEEEIDLKKILGTTNEYKEKDDSNKENSDNKENNQGTNNPENNNGTGNNSGNTNINNEGVVTKEEGSTISDTTIINETTDTSVIRITPTIDKISIDYVIYDKIGEYLTTFIEIKSPSETKIVHLNKSSTNITLPNLLPGTEYKLTFKYTHLLNGEVAEETFGNYNIKTLLPDINLNISKVTSKKIEYKISTSAYNISSAKLTLYVNGIKQNKELSINSNNLTGTFNLSGIEIKNNSLVELRLENIYIKEILVDKEVSYSYKVKSSVPNEENPQEEEE